MKEKVSVLITEEEVDKRIRELGRQISDDYEGESIHIVSILKGGAFITCELAKRITVPVAIDFMCVSSYQGTDSTGKVTITKDLDKPIEGENILIVEDIVDTGRTLSFLMDMFKQRGAKSLKLCTLLDKPERRIAKVDSDYTGFVIPDKFVVGYGLDYDQKYRNLPYVGVVEFEEE